MNVLLLQSVDGQEHARVVLYPDAWTIAAAQTLAVEAFDAAQRRRGDDWDWRDCEPQLIARGFVVPLVTLGPTWDLNRSEPEER
jgi:hypothetical protein